MTRKENDVPDIVTRDELLIGELTAALAAESMSAQDALPPAFAARAIAATLLIEQGHGCQHSQIVLVQLFETQAAGQAVQRRPAHRTPYHLSGNQNVNPA